jgi:hypothetical protein
MGKMVEAIVAETMQFGVAEHEEEDLYSPYAHIAASEFNRQPFAHHEEYVASLTANTRKSNNITIDMHGPEVNIYI